MPGAARAARGLALACHPGPTLVVALFMTAYAVRVVGYPAGPAALLALAVLTGQLSIGWSNDALDADLDRLARRQDKPSVTAGLSPRWLWSAAAAAAVACVVTSLALGLAAGAVHLAAVGMGWAYNLGLKRSALSPVPYLLAFAALPVVITLAAPASASGPRPGPAVVVAVALLGVAAHFANTVRDVSADAATGVRGLPQRLGPGTSMVVAAAGVALAALALLVSPERPGPIGTWLLAAGTAVALAGIAARGRVAFPLTLVAVALVIGGLLGP